MREREGVAAQERSDIEKLLANVRKLPPDSKVEKLKKVLADLRCEWLCAGDGFHPIHRHHGFIREELVPDNDARVICSRARR